MVEGEEEGCRTHRLAGGFCAIAPQSRVRMCLCNSPAEGLRSLEQLVVVAVQRRMSPEQSDMHLSSHVASVRQQLRVYGGRSRSSLHRPIDQSRIQEQEKSRLLGCRESSCWLSDDS
jgi:hypothetical protein